VIGALSGCGTLVQVEGSVFGGIERLWLNPQ
jgi:hypothetical protein